MGRVDILLAGRRRSRAGRRRRMGGDGTNYTPLILVAVGLAAVYAAYEGIFGGAPGPGAQNNTTVAATSTAATTQALADAKAAGDIQMLNTSELSGIANTIWTEGSAHGNGPLDIQYQEDILNEMKLPESLTDLLLVKQNFGIKQVSTSIWTGCETFGINCNAVDLDAFLKLVFDTDHLAQLNTWLSNININYEFS